MGVVDLTLGANWPEHHKGEPEDKIYSFSSQKAAEQQLCLQCLLHRAVVWEKLIVNYLARQVMKYFPYT